MDMDELNPHKLSLQLTKHGEEIEIRAESSGGQARCETQFPSDAIVNQIGDKNPSKISSKDTELVGEQLHNLLFIGDVGKLASDIIDTGRRFNQPIFIELRFDADQISLAKFPWELIKNELGQYLVRDGIVDLTRSITYPQPMPSLRQNLKEINLLRVIARPPKLPPITTVNLIAKDIETIDHATFPIIQRRLLIERSKSWGFQFDGHGALLLKCKECECLNDLTAKKCIRCNNTLSDAKQIGVLAFEHNGDVDFVSTEEFGSVLYNSGIQLALLMACETSRIGNEIIFNGLAPNLILSGVPAVIGMQFPVLDSFANSFANSFYEVLFKTGDLFNAVRTARRMNIQGAWYNPAVYLRHKPTEEVDKPIFKTRQIDTAAPEEVIVSNHFLVRLWIRRPTTLPQTDKELRKSLGISEYVEIATDMFEADVKFEKVKGKEFRIGEVLVKLQSTECEIKTENIRLFVDENRDAPPAIFVVKANKTGKIPIVFSVWQDENMIASIIHQIDIVEIYSKPELAIEKNSGQISVGKPIVESFDSQLSIDRDVRRERLEEESLEQRHLFLEFRDRAQFVLVRNNKLEQRLVQLYDEWRMTEYSLEVRRELDKVRHEVERSRDLRLMLEGLQRDMAIREFPPQLFFEYRHRLEEVEEQNRRLEALFERVYREIESRSHLKFNLDELLRDAQRAEDKLPILTILLKIFQVCPMMGEPSIYEQMRHFSKCSQCFSYIRKEPETEELHPLLKGFLVYCYKENLLRNLEHDIQSVTVKDNFPTIINRWGSDLFRAFEKYMSVIPREEIERDYLEFKKRTHRRENAG